MPGSNLPLIADPLFYLAAIPAVILTGLAKAGPATGSGALAVPLLTLVVSAPQALAVMLPILMVTDVMGMITFRRRFDARILRLTVPAGLLGILIGWALFHVVDARWIKAIIGIEAIIFAMHRLLAERRTVQTAPTPLAPMRARIWSVVSGFTSFISHAGGPPMMHFMLPLRLDAFVFVGTLAWFFAIINFAKLLPYGQLGLLGPVNLATSLVLLPVVPIGYLLGLRLLRWLEVTTFLRIATWSLLATGIKLTWDAFA